MSCSVKIIKNWAVILTAVVMILSAGLFTSCNKNGENGGLDEGLYVDGKAVVKIGTVFSEDAELTGTLGTPLDRQESASCLGAGTDINFIYDGFSLTAYPYGDAGQHRVGQIKITGDQYSLSTGVSVGDNISSMESASYGLASHTGSSYTYDACGGQCSLVVSTDESGIITRIVLNLND